MKKSIKVDENFDDCRTIKGFFETFEYVPILPMDRNNGIGAHR